MSFLKALCLAIIATIFLTYVLGSSFLELFDVDIYLDDQFIEPIQAIGISAIVMVILVLVALAIALSVFGSFIFIAVLLAGGLAMLLLGTLWPIIVVALVIWLVTRDNREPQY